MVPLLALARCSLVLLSAVPLLVRSTSARVFEAPVVAVQVAAVELPPVAVEAAVLPLVLQLLRAAVLLLRACSQRALVLLQVAPV